MHAVDTRDTRPSEIPDDTGRPSGVVAVPAASCGHAGACRGVLLVRLLVRHLGQLLAAWRRARRLDRDAETMAFGPGPWTHDRAVEYLAAEESARRARAEFHTLASRVWRWR